MRTVTFGECTLDKGHATVQLARDTAEVACGFTSSDRLQNGAWVHMSIAEARNLAHQLIVYADRLDPDYG